MPRTAHRPITYYIDTPSVRVFTAFAGDTLENLTISEALDIISILSQCLNDALSLGVDYVCTERMSDMLNLSISANTEACLNALNGFPVSQVMPLMMGITSIAAED